MNPSQASAPPELLLAGPADALLRSLDALRGVRDPGVGASILELGLVESLRLRDGVLRNLRWYRSNNARSTELPP